ncbi:MAG: DUF3459 domain-containing protein [Dehalococcoidia bacterium]
MRSSFFGFPAFAIRSDAGVSRPAGRVNLLRSRLDPGRSGRATPIERVYRELITLRLTDPTLREPDRAATRAGAVRADMVAVWRTGPGGPRLLLANFGAAATVTPADVAPGDGATVWRLIWRTPPSLDPALEEGLTVREGAITVPGQCAVLFGGT